jgi:hypothetical protein
MIKCPKCSSKLEFPLASPKKIKKNRLIPSLSFYIELQRVKRAHAKEGDNLVFTIEFNTHRPTHYLLFNL